jgi:hypothetical protein
LRFFLFVARDWRRDKWENFSDTGAFIMDDDEANLPGKTTWASVQGIIITGSVMRDADGISALVLSEDGTKTKVRGQGDLYSALVSEAAARGGNVIFQGHLEGDGPGLPSLNVRIVGPIELIGQVSELSFSRGEETPRMSFRMTREITLPTGEVVRVPTGVNVYGPDADALSGLRAGDRVSLQARHGEDGFLAVTPVTVLDD